MSDESNDDEDTLPISTDDITAQVHLENESIEDEDNSNEEIEVAVVSQKTEDEIIEETVEEPELEPESIVEHQLVDNDFNQAESTLSEDSEYSNELQVAETLSIPAVYDVIEEKEYDTREFFQKYSNKDGEEYLMTLRTSLEQAILLNKPHFICSYCRQMVKLCGRKFRRGRISYFAHYRDSENCPYKTSTNQTVDEINARKYSLEQESLRHKKLKALIADALSFSRSQEMGIDNVVCEKRINSNIPYLNWRRPDICADWGDKKLVFELQLSTTFLSVVVDRDIFYRLNNYFIIWVFNFEDNQEYMNLSNLMCKDIYYSNKRNVFIFDEEARRRSEEAQELVLRCRWLDKDGKWSKDEFVTLADLKFDEEKYKPYYYDADKDFFEKHPDALERRLKIEHSREYILSALMERQKAEKEKQEAEKLKAREKLNKEEADAEPFCDSGKWGMRYAGTVLLEPVYNKIEFKDEGFAEVTVGRNIGIISRDARILIPCEYKHYYTIDAEKELFFAYDKHIDFFNHGHNTSVVNIDPKRDSIISNIENGVKTFTLEKKGPYDRSRKEYNMSYVKLAQTKGESLIVRSENESHKYDESTLEPKIFHFAEMSFTSKEGIYVVSDGKHYGIVSEDETILLPLEYETFCFIDEYLKVSKLKYNTYYREYYCLVDLFGRVIIPCEYDRLDYYNEEHCFIAKYGDSMGLMSLSGEKLTEFIYEHIERVEERRFKAKISYDRFVILDDRGKHVETSTNATYNQWVIKECGNVNAIVDAATNELLLDYKFKFKEFALDRIVIEESSQEYYIADEHGNALSDNKYYKIEAYSPNGTNVQLSYYESSVGIIDIDGNPLKSLIEVDDNLFIYHTLGKNWGIQDKNGNPLLDSEYHKIERVFPDSSLLKIYSEEGYYTRCALYENGQFKSDFDYKEIIVLNLIYFKYKTNDYYENWQLGTKDVIFSTKFSSLSLLGEDCFCGKTTSGLNIIDSNGNIILSTDYNDISFICKNRYLVEKRDYPHKKYGVIDLEGNIILPVIFTSIDAFVDRKANAMIGDNAGYVTLDGEQESELVENYREYNLYNSFGRFYFSTAAEYKSGGIEFESVQKIDVDLFVVKTEKRCGVYNPINKSYIIRPIYDRIEFREDGYFKIEQNGLCGLANKDGNIIVELLYSSIALFIDGKAEVVRNKQCGYIDTNGHEFAETIETNNSSKLIYKFGEYSFVDKYEKNIFSSAFIKVNQVQEGYYLATMPGGKMTILYPETKKRLPVKSNIKSLRNLFFAIRKGKGWYFYKGFELLNNNSFYAIETLGETMFAVKTYEYNSRSWYNSYHSENWKIMNEQGELYPEIEFAAIPYCLSGDYYVGKSGQGPEHDLYHKGELLVKNRCWSIKKVTLDRFIAQTGNRSFIILDEKGNQLTVTSYNNIQYQEESNDFQVRSNNYEFIGNLNYDGKAEDESTQEICNGDYVIYKQFGKFGVRNKKGETTIPPVHISIEVVINDILKLPDVYDHRFYIVSADGKNRINHTFCNCIVAHDKILLLQKNGSYSSLNYWGAILLDFSEIIPFEFTKIEEGENDQLIAYKNTDKGVFNIKGEAIPTQSNFAYGYKILQHLNMIGLVNPEGNTVISLSNVKIEQITEEIISVKESNLCRLYNLRQNNFLEDMVSSVEKFGDSHLKVCKNRFYALFTITGERLTDFIFESIEKETDSRFVIKKNGYIGYIDENGQIIDSMVIAIPDSDYTIFQRMQRFGLRDERDRVILQPEYKQIRYLTNGLLTVRKESKCALYGVDGTSKTKDVYSNILCNAEGCIIATRDNVKGFLDNEGNEIAKLEPFNGGFVRSCFGDYSILDESKNVLISGDYSNIEILDNDGVFALWRNGKVKLANKSKFISEDEFESIKNAGQGFYIVSKTITKKIRTRKTGYGYRGNPYTYYETSTQKNKRFGIITESGKIVIRCKYISLSEFNSEGNIIAVNEKNEQKTITLKSLEQKKDITEELVVGEKYVAKVKSFMPIGLIVKIKATTYIVHRKHLYKDLKTFSKGDMLEVTFTGYDIKGHIMWTTQEYHVSKDSESKIDNVTEKLE